MAKYYIIDTRSVVGNCALFWRPDGQGYTCDVDDAGIYDEAEAFRKRDTDIPIPVEDIERLVVKHVRADTNAFYKLLRDAKQSAQWAEQHLRGNDPNDVGPFGSYE